ncbi:MAG: GNAT family N-acetyltransferase [Nitrospirae bacterium]|nr:GNAT family N-acetyltransferase [Nitrospirota bacterium]
MNNDVVQQEARQIAFFEGEFLVKTLQSEEEMRQAYHLRHRVFAEKLKWVPERTDKLESDIYDAWSTSIGLFSTQQQLLGMVRMTPAPLPFMLESEFSGCLANNIRYTYLVVESRLLRVVQWIGWPCHAIGDPVALPPADVLSVGALLDLDEFRSVAVSKRPEMLEWLHTMEPTTTEIVARV